jgi:hypothetical protein
MSPILGARGGLSAKAYGFTSAVAAGALGDYQAIVTATVDSGEASSVTISSIPSTFKHLQLRIFCSDSGTNPDFNIKIQFNSDTGNNYARHLLSGNGTSASASGSPSTNYIGAPYTSNSSTTYGGTITDILNYADTSKYKTARSIGGIDLSGSGYAMFRSGVWMSSSAITSITFTTDAGSASFRRYSQFALYGIKGA